MASAKALRQGWLRHVWKALGPPWLLISCFSVGKRVFHFLLFLGEQLACLLTCLLG